MRHITPAESAGMLATFAKSLAPVIPNVGPHSPFSKRAEGKARRMERRRVRAAKSAWLNS